MAGCFGLCLALFGTPAAAEQNERNPDVAVTELDTLDVSIVAVSQQLGADASDTGERQRRLNLRLDLQGRLPLLDRGRHLGGVVGHLRAGLGTGVVTEGLFGGTVNGTGFDGDDGADDRYGIVAEAYYHHLYRLGGGSAGFGSADLTGSSHLAFAAGKFEAFTFFDHNEFAAEEAETFLNESFMHNPILGVGDDIGADSYGFSPGVRAAYFNNTGRRHGWGVSIGLLSAGDEATTRRLPRKPLVIVQGEVTTKGQGGDVLGTIRLYAWRNRMAEDFDEQMATHNGWGVSLDHRLVGDIGIFGRYGERTRGAGLFNRALTAGVVVAGAGWNRPEDLIGIGFGRLAAGSRYGSSVGQGAGGLPPGAERTVEVFYRFDVGRHLEVTPDFQYVARPGGLSSASSVRVVGLKIRFSP